MMISLYNSYRHMVKVLLLLVMLLLPMSAGALKVFSG